MGRGSTLQAGVHSSGRGPLSRSGSTLQPGGLLSRPGAHSPDRGSTVQVGVHSSGRGSLPTSGSIPRAPTLRTCTRHSGVLRSRSRSSPARERAEEGPERRAGGLPGPAPSRVTGGVEGRRRKLRADGPGRSRPSSCRLCLVSGLDFRNGFRFHRWRRGRRCRRLWETRDSFLPAAPDARSPPLALRPSLDVRGGGLRTAGD